eukprot:TRINITY_DN2584_c0_g1_i1.p1 TRINITY_DN2584_c0_g1~~TRINITY_DN2584_c0_g1_i1.p1  ORF type:complete len:373 (+),score=6.72 TRINITY_DN2584_c0_g1_i1:68-1120(+)
MAKGDDQVYFCCLFLGLIAAVVVIPVVLQLAFVFLTIVLMFLRTALAHALVLSPFFATLVAVISLNKVHRAFTARVGRDRKQSQMQALAIVGLSVARHLVASSRMSTWGLALLSSLVSMAPALVVFNNPWIALQCLLLFNLFPSLIESSCLILAVIVWSSVPTTMFWDNCSRLRKTCLVAIFGIFCFLIPSPLGRGDIELFRGDLTQVWAWDCFVFLKEIRIGIIWAFEPKWCLAFDDSASGNDNFATVSFFLILGLVAVIRSRTLVNNPCFVCLTASWDFECDGHGYCKDCLNRFILSCCENDGGIAFDRDHYRFRCCSLDCQRKELVCRQSHSVLKNEAARRNQANRS